MLFPILEPVSFSPRIELFLALFEVSPIGWIAWENVLRCVFNFLENLIDAFS